MVAVPQLGGDEDLLPRHPALPHRASHALLVPVQAGGVDVPVSDFQCELHGLLGRPPGRRLVDAEPEQGHLHARVELAGGRYGQSQFAVSGTGLARPTLNQSTRGRPPKRSFNRDARMNEMATPSSLFTNRTTTFWRLRFQGLRLTMLTLLAMLGGGVTSSSGSRCCSTPSSE